MDEEMNFPNPVVRTDLPTRRRRWPRVLGIVAVLGLLTLIFLPQILGSKVGRKFVVSYLSAKTNSPVTLESFQTSWFGGTTVRFLSIPDPMGRRMGFKSLTCKASLFNLLRGKYKLGDTVIDGLNVDYVINDGRGSDSFDRMKDPPPDSGPAGPPAPPRLPFLSGKITINSGTLTLFRGTVQPKLYNVTWEAAKLEAVEATLNIESLDKPWTFTFAADTIEGSAPRGSITASGTIDLGENGQTGTKQVQADVTLTAENLRTGNLGAALLPAATPPDLREALGPVLDKVDVAVKAIDGKWAFERCAASGLLARFQAFPTLDITTNPATLIVDGGPAKPSVFSLGVSKRLAQGWGVYLNPFFREAIGGQGTVDLSIEQLRVPLGPQWPRSIAAQGRLVVRGATLDRSDEMTAAQPVPDNLASQLALLTGDAEKTVQFQADGRFTAAAGEAAVAPMRTTVGDTTLALDGSTELETGNIKMTATLVAAPRIAQRLQSSGAASTGDKTVPALVIPITGTIRLPQLGVFNLKGDLADAALKSINADVNEQITRMRSKETQRLMQKSQNQVEEILRPLKEPTTQPAGK